MKEDAWELEHEPGQPPKLEFKPKAHLVLEGSEQHEWGLVKDCHGCINMIPDDAEIVGVWNKYGDGIFWVSLQTSLSALEDRATQLYVELAEGRIDAMGRMSILGVSKKASKKERKSRGLEAEPPHDDTFDKLRAKLGKK